MDHIPLSTNGKKAIDVATEAVIKAGDILQKMHSGKSNITWKGKSNIVTDADIKAEKAILDIINKEFPDHDLVAEESGKSDTGSEYSWIIDPLDGTNNFAFGIPVYCVAVSLVMRNEALIGVTYDPVHEELFQAEKGKGAYLNGSRITVSKRTALENSFIGFDMGYDMEQAKRMLITVSSLWPGIHSLRILGSGALGIAYVACGRLDVYIHRCLFPWDISGGLLLVREAGGIVTDWQGVPATLYTQQILAGNPVLHRKFKQWYKGLSDSPD